MLDTLRKKKKTKYHWVASNSGADYLPVDEMTFFLKEKQDSKHNPPLAGSDIPGQRLGRSSGQCEVTFTECSLSFSAVLLAYLKELVHFPNHSRRFVLHILPQSH